MTKSELIEKISETLKLPAGKAEAIAEEMMRRRIVLVLDGVEPLQQYLLELPGGRLQGLTIAWDSRPKDKGGQRWFSLYPNEKIGFRDPLHWTRAAQNWNFVCADCHSTNLRRNYDAPARDRC